MVLTIITLCTTIVILVLVVVRRNKEVKELEDLMIDQAKAIDTLAENYRKAFRSVKNREDLIAEIVKEYGSTATPSNLRKAFPERGGLVILATEKDGAFPVNIRIKKNKIIIEAMGKKYLLEELDNALFLKI